MSKHVTTGFTVLLGIGVWFTLAVLIALNAGAAEPTFCEKVADDAKALPTEYRDAALATAYKQWRSTVYDTEDQLKWAWVTIIMERVFTGDYVKVRGAVQACNQEFGQ